MDQDRTEAKQAPGDGLIEIGARYAVDHDFKCRAGNQAVFGDHAAIGDGKLGRSLANIGAEHQGCADHDDEEGGIAERLGKVFCRTCTKEKIEEANTVITNKAASNSDQEILQYRTIQ